MRFSSHFFPAIIIGVLAVACDPKYVFEKSYEIDPAGWAYADTLRYEFAIADTMEIYDLLLDVQHRTDYRFQNLYVQIYTQFPDGQRLSKPVSLEFANVAGEWQGHCNTSACNIEVLLQAGAYFNQLGTYAITIEQYMREPMVAGVEKVALKLRRTGRKRN